ncbi:uncharacterized protein LOC144172762 [Haemaphysalis longicornis]
MRMRCFKIYPTRRFTASYNLLICILAASTSSCNSGAVTGTTNSSYSSLEEVPSTSHTVIPATRGPSCPTTADNTTSNGDSIAEQQTTTPLAAVADRNSSAAVTKGGLPSGSSATARPTLQITSETSSEETTFLTAGRGNGTLAHSRFESSRTISATQAANITPSAVSDKSYPTHTLPETRSHDDVTTQVASSSMTLSRSTEVLNSTSSKVPNVPIGPHDVSLENSSTSLMSNEFGTGKTDSFTTNVLASTKDAATSTSAEAAPRSRPNKGAIFATVIGAAVLLMGVIVMGFWFYNVRWKLNQRDRPLLRRMEAPVSTPMPFSIVYYQNDAAQEATLRRS